MEKTKYGLDFYFVTDTHYFSPALIHDEKLYRKYMLTQQFCMAENKAIFEATVNELLANDDAKIIVFGGDLIKNGCYANHLDYIAQLDRLKEAGKKIFVILASHDYINENPLSFYEDYVPIIRATDRQEAYELYKDFGWSEAVAVDEQSKSYVAQLAKGYRCVFVNCVDDRRKGRISSRILDWIDEQAKEAKKAGDEMIAVCHYPIIPSSPVFELIEDAQVKNWRKVASRFADAGIRLVMTGHMHAQSVRKFTSDKGNTLCDVCTAALVGYPAKYRKVSYDGNNLSLKSYDVPDFDWDMQGLTKKEYFLRQYDSIINTTLDAAANDYETFVKMLTGKKDAGKAYKPIVSVAGKILNSATLGQLGNFLLIRVDKSIRKVKLRDFLLMLTHCICDGRQHYDEKDPYYKLLEKMFSRLSVILKPVNRSLSKDGQCVDIGQLVLGTVNNRGMDFDDCDICVS